MRQVGAPFSTIDCTLYWGMKQRLTLIALLQSFAKRRESMANSDNKYLAAIPFRDSVSEIRWKQVLVLQPSRSTKQTNSQLRIEKVEEIYWLNLDVTLDVSSDTIIGLSRSKIFCNLRSSGQPKLGCLFDHLPN